MSTTLCPFCRTADPEPNHPCITTDLLLTVAVDPSTHIAYVKHADTHHFPEVTQIFIGPNPTWPSPAETNDLIAQAVREMLDLAWETATGDKVER